MAFPRLNALSFWLLLFGGIILYSGLRLGRRAGRLRLDELPAAVGALARPWPGPVDRGPACDRHLIADRGDQLPLHHPQHARARNAAVADAAVHVDDRDLLDHDRGRRAGAGGSAHDAAARPQLRHELLQPGPLRQRAALPAPVLVLLAPGGVRDGAARVRNDLRDPAGVLAQAAVRLSRARVLHRGDRLPRLPGLGPPHVRGRVLGAAADLVHVHVAA